MSRVKEESMENPYGGVFVASIVVLGIAAAAFAVRRAVRQRRQRQALLPIAGQITEDVRRVVQANASHVVHRTKFNSAVEPIPNSWPRVLRVRIVVGITQTNDRSIIEALGGRVVRKWTQDNPFLHISTDYITPKGEVDHE